LVCKNYFNYGDRLRSTKFIQILKVLLAARSIKVVADFNVKFSEVFSALTDSNTSL